MEIFKDIVINNLMSIWKKVGALKGISSSLLDCIDAENRTYYEKMSRVLEELERQMSDDMFVFEITNCILYLEKRQLIRELCKMEYSRELSAMYNRGLFKSANGNNNFISSHYNPYPGETEEEKRAKMDAELSRTMGKMNLANNQLMEANSSLSNDLVYMRKELMDSVESRDISLEKYKIVMAENKLLTENAASDRTTIKMLIEENAVLKSKCVHLLR